MCLLERRPGPPSHGGRRCVEECGGVVSLSDARPSERRSLIAEQRVEQGGAGRHAGWPLNSRTFLDEAADALAGRTSSPRRRLPPLPALRSARRSRVRSSRGGRRRARDDAEHADSDPDAVAQVVPSARRCGAEICNTIVVAAGTLGSTKCETEGHPGRQGGSRRAPARCRT